MEDDGSINMYVPTVSSTEIILVSNEMVAKVTQDIFHTSLSLVVAHIKHFLYKKASQNLAGM